MRDSQQEILHFWFVESKPQQWFQRNEDFDSLIRDRFQQTYVMASTGLCDAWMKDADGCLALIVLLDQFPRNMYRGTSKAFQTDANARRIANHAISKGFDQVLNPVKRRFIYLPFEHSENLEDQKRSVELFSKMVEDDPLGHEYALRHYRVIEQFGRFPHRNAILGRPNTAQEEVYLAQTDAGF